MMERTLALLAPLSGPVVPLADVPDPVFAGRVVGDGLAIDPTSRTVLAPCSGLVAALPASAHAITLRTSHGLEVLVHVGVDTVKLRGRGFRALVVPGQQVVTGEPLLEFEPEVVADGAPSLLTEVIVAPHPRLAGLDLRSGDVRAGLDPLLVVRLREVEEEAGEVAAEGDALPEVAGEPVLLPNPQGLHARPAAVLAAAARGFAARAFVERDGRRADARSVVALMALETVCGDRLRVIARGEDAALAVARLGTLLASGLGEVGVAPAATDSPLAAAAVDESPLPAELHGLPAAPGLATGRVHRVQKRLPEPPAHRGPAADERAALDAALDTARAQLRALENRLAAEQGPARGAIFAAHAELLDDPDLAGEAANAIAAGASAPAAWTRAFQAQAARLSGLSRPLLAARAADVRDVGARVLHALMGVPMADAGSFPDESVLVADELTPSDVVGLDPARIRGLATTGGGPTSHVAILARALGLPAVVGLDPRALRLASGTPVVLDGDRGVLRVAPDAAELGRVSAAVERRRARLAGWRAAAAEPATTVDGHRVAVCANAGRVADVAAGAEAGADGVGLFRTELLFGERTQPPDEDEQAATYERALRASPLHPLVFRLLDVGGDKLLPWLPLPREDNPFLGVRGIRLLLARPELLRTQARALLRASRAGGRPHVMLPMVTSAAEVRAARALFEAEAQELAVAMPPLGVMVEVPAAALAADALAAGSDFFSIGTNDLTQYTLAMDRGHPRLAARVDGLEPAVLRLIQSTTAAARRHGRHVAVCGGLASDPQAVPFLLGLGVQALSVSVPQIPEIKARVRGLRQSACEALAALALAAEDAAAVRALAATSEE